VDRRRSFHPRNPGKFPAKKRPAYSTVLTMVRRLEAKKALRQVKKIGTAFIYEAPFPATPPAAA